MLATYVLWWCAMDTDNESNTFVLYADICIGGYVPLCDKHSKYYCIKRIKDGWVSEYAHWYRENISIVEKIKLFFIILLLSDVHDTIMRCKDCPDYLFIPELSPGWPPNSISTTEENH